MSKLMKNYDKLIEGYDKLIAEYDELIQQAEIALICLVGAAFGLALILSIAYAYIP